MFSNAERFNSDIAGWTVTKLADLSGMFASASSFSQDLCAWRTSLPSYAFFESTFMGTACTSTSDPVSVALGPVCAVCPSLPPTPSPTPGPGTASPTSHKAQFTSTDQLRSAVEAAQFAGADCGADVYSTYGPMSAWDVSLLDNLDSIFQSKGPIYCHQGGHNLNNWNVSQVTSMQRMSQVDLVNIIPVYSKHF
jgi:hypothetical protein